MLLKTWLILVLVVLTTMVALLTLRNKRVSALLHEHIADRPRRRLFLAAIGFFVNFTIVRSLAYANFHKIGPFHDIYIRGRHIHHLVWGILILLAVGFGWLVELGTGG